MKRLITLSALIAFVVASVSIESQAAFERGAAPLSQAPTPKSNAAHHGKTGASAKNAKHGRKSIKGKPAAKARKAKPASKRRNSH